jgi:ABC-type multidrug transport system ATPase subunit
MLAGNRGSDPVLVVSNLERRFGDREVVKRLTLAPRPGERVALRGPNGSGKTTVLRCIAGTLSLSGGSVTIGGSPVGSVAARRLTGVSLSQERSFYMRLSGRSNLTFFARVRGHGKTAALRIVSQLEEELHLSDILDERADRCSTGMIQQLALARALLGDPQLLLLDEPTRSLDKEAVRRMWSALERRVSTSVVIATHTDTDVAHCDWTVDLPA